MASLCIYLFVSAFPGHLSGGLPLLHSRADMSAADMPAFPGHLSGAPLASPLSIYQHVLQAQQVWPERHAGLAVPFLT